MCNDLRTRFFLFKNLCNKIVTIICNGFRKTYCLTYNTYLFKRPKQHSLSFYTCSSPIPINMRVSFCIILKHVCSSFISSSSVINLLHIVSIFIGSSCTPSLKEPCINVYHFFMTFRVLSLYSWFF